MRCYVEVRYVRPMGGLGRALSVAKTEAGGMEDEETAALATPFFYLVSQVYDVEEDFVGGLDVSNLDEEEGQDTDTDDD